MLTVEYDEKSEHVAISFDPEGLRFLKATLERLKENDHAHLMTPAWSGSELDEKPLGERTKLIHHLRLVHRELHW